jgi:hypothetical protein
MFSLSKTRLLTPVGGCLKAEPRRRGGVEETNNQVGNRLCVFLVQTKRSRHPAQINA